MSAYVTIEDLGENSYLNIARIIFLVRHNILALMKSLRFKPIGTVEFIISVLENPNADIFSFVIFMDKKGWRFHLQQRISYFQVPNNIHFTFSLIHYGFHSESIKDVSESIYEESSNYLNHLLSYNRTGNLENILTEVINGEIYSSMLPILLADLPENIVNQILKEIVIRWYK